MKTHLIAALTLGLLASWLTAAEPEVLHKWEFHSQADAARWVPANDLKDLTVTGDRLRVTITGADAYLHLPPVDLPLDGLRVRIRMRSDRAGQTELFWRTAGEPEFHQLQVLAQTTRATLPDELLTVEFQLGNLSDAGRRLAGLRIDPANNNHDGTVEIASVELLRMPPVFDLNFAPSAAHVDINEPFHERVSIRQTEGASHAGPAITIVQGGVRHEVQLAPASQPAGGSSLLTRLGEPGVHFLSANAEIGEAHYELQSSIIVGRGEHLPLRPGLRSERVRLDLIPARSGDCFGAARWQVADQQGNWHQAGWLLPLAELAIRQEHNEIRTQPAFTLREQSERALVLESAPPGWNIRLSLALREPGPMQNITVDAALTAEGAGELLNFSGPVLRADRDPAGNPLERHGLFGGLEFLEPGWASSSERAVGPKYAQRWAPHPFKITVPLMAVEAADVTTALMWHPQPLPPDHQSPAAGSQHQICADSPPSEAGASRRLASSELPVSSFASPNFIDGQSNHLMKLSLPGIPDYRSENELVARAPLPLNEGETVRLTCCLYAEAGLPVVQTTRRWYQLFGPVTAPPLPQGELATYDLIARNFGQTMHWPAQKGWTQHWFFPESPRYNPTMAGELIAHAQATGKRDWIDATGQSGRSILEAVGTIAPRIRDASHAKAMITAMRADGTFPFHNTAQIRKQCLEWTHGKFDSLGQEGSTSLGTCVMAALPIIKRAYLTGESEFVAAMNRALEAMSSFHVPRGAQVWEVHQEIPDIRAAALAIEAFRMAYEITGEKRWLDQAAYWAWTGVPFIYSWHVPIEGNLCTVLISRDRSEPRWLQLPADEAFQNPNRQVTPYGIVPVLGPTFYVHNWFGVLVQWCGLEWAWKVIELDRLKPDPLLRSIADGVVASGLQQTLDREPWVGLYPDSWDLQGNRAQPAYISSALTLACLQAQGRIPSRARPWTRIVRDQTGNRQWHVSGWGAPAQVPPPQPGTWLASIDFLKGQPSEMVLANVDAPRTVRIGQEVLPQLDSPQPGAATVVGWWYWPQQRALVARFKQLEERVTVRVDW